MDLNMALLIVIVVLIGVVAYLNWRLNNLWKRVYDLGTIVGDIVKVTGETRSSMKEMIELIDSMMIYPNNRKKRR